MKLRLPLCYVLHRDAPKRALFLHDCPIADFEQKSKSTRTAGSKVYNELAPCQHEQQVRFLHDDFRGAVRCRWCHSVH
jgi:hypothetical protein